MKQFLILTAIFIFLFRDNSRLTAQSGESKFKRVVISGSEKTVSPLYPDFAVSSLSFSEANMNHRLDGREEGSIGFYIRNTGTVILQQLNVSLAAPDTIKGLKYDRLRKVGPVKIGESLLVDIPLKADENLEDGDIAFRINIRDAGSDSSKTFNLSVPAREALKPPGITFTNPVSSRDSVNYSVYLISGLIRTKTEVTGMKLFVNSKIPDDERSFDLFATGKKNEYRFERSIMLGEGINEIKIEARNDQGVTTSEPRIVRYILPRHDQLYVEKRLALVIGNANYVNSPPLRNPINDAEAIAIALQQVGFTVLKYLDTDLRTIKKAMDEFGEKLQNYNVGLFYYAGHGLQVKGNNYLIPVDAVLNVEQDVDYDCVDAGRLLGKMEAAGTGTNIVILDACRDNPFQRSWGGRGVGQGEAGLAFMNAPSGSIVAYATSPGRTASDGPGKNGLYTEAILKYINVPNLPIEDFFKYVRVDVEKLSNKTQTPWESTSLKGNFYFKIK